jgi:geranylgeranyl reductase family protein
MTERWDLVVVGSGPAGAATALGALHSAPGLSVLLLDRSDFPRDKACGDGVAPHVDDLLASVGVHGLLDDLVPVRRLELQHSGVTVSREMPRAAYVVPRTTLDARLLAGATAAGARFRRQRVRAVRPDAGSVQVEGISARVVVGADGAHSVVRQVTGGRPSSRTALAVRGYAPVRPVDAGKQTIVFGTARQPSYAWSFDRGDGLANVGYGELLHPGRPALPRAQLVGQLERLLPGSTADGTSWRGHHLPLSTWTWRQPDGRCLLAGDAAHLINPVTGEGIYYAVATGILAGRAAAAAVRDDGGRTAGSRYRQAVRGLLGRHLKHTSVVRRLIASPALARAGIRAAATDQRIFDDLVELGLAQGRVTPRTAAALARQVAGWPG